MAPKKGNEASKLLLDAVRQMDEEAIQEQLAAGADLGYQHPEDGSFALMWAAYNGDASSVGVLLDALADANKEDFPSEEAYGKRTALHWAAIGGGRKADEVCQRLVSKNAVVNLKDVTGMTPLHYAAQGGFLEVVKALIGAGADLHTTDGCEQKNRMLKMRTKYTPLHRACAMGTLRHTEVCRELLQQNAKPYKKTGFGETPMMLARHHQPTARLIEEFLDPDEERKAEEEEDEDEDS